MNKKYNFYYDESEHSRKINKKTVNASNYYDNFVTVSVGWNQVDEKKIEKNMAHSRISLKKKSKGELKNTTLKPNNFKYGLSSLNADNVQFIHDFLNVFDEKVFLYFSVTSKIEYVINQLFVDYHSNFFEDIELMKYTIVKSILMYRPEDIINGMCDDSSKLIELLKGFFIHKIDENKKNLELKERENTAFSQILLLLDDINENVEIGWNYDIAFHGFLKYIKEMEIGALRLQIDKEGKKGNTLNAAKRVGIQDVCEIDSMKSFGVRIADMLAGIISKLLKAFHNALRYNNSSDYYGKKLLCEEWFRLNEQQFALYKKLRFVISEINNAWYKSYEGIYSDDLMGIVVLLSYIGGFASLEEFNKIDKKMHRENLNTWVCDNLEKHFKRLGSKLPVIPVGNNNQEFYFDQRGAKVYFDISKHHLLEIPTEGIIIQVLAVGFLVKRKFRILLLKWEEKQFTINYRKIYLSGL